jgi:hypothetical protein
MFKEEPSSLSAFSVVILIASTWLLAQVWYTENPFVLGWEPYQPLYVAILGAMLFLSLLGIWKSTSQE